MFKCIILLVGMEFLSKKKIAQLDMRTCVVEKYCIAGNFQGTKLFTSDDSFICNREMFVDIFSAFMNFFFLQKLILHNYDFRENPVPQKFPAIQYLLYKFLIQIVCG